MKPGPRAALALLALASLAASVAACSRDDPSGAGTRGSSASAASASGASPWRTASCDRVPSASVCSEYSGAYLAQNEAVITSQCNKLGGAFVPAECPNTSVLGSCALGTSEVRNFYASGAVAFDAARAEKECTSSYKGKWSAFK